MRGSRAERGFVPLALCLVLLCFAHPLAAQTGAPVPLTPSLEGGAAQPSPPAATPAPLSPPPAAAGTGVEAAPLEPVANDAVGPLESEAGLGPQLWQGSSRSLIESLIPQIPNAPSPAMRALVRRLVLTSAIAPEGQGAADLLQLRADRLMTLGMAGDAAALLSLVPAPRLDAALLTRLLAAALTAGDAGTACKAAQEHADLLADAAGQKVLIFCTFQAGDRDRAYLLFDLLQEQGDADAAFAAAVAILDGTTSRDLPKSTAPTPLLIAMLAAAKRSPPDDWYRGAQPALLPVLLALPGRSDARIGAAERAARLALIAPAGLAAAYQAVAVPGPERTAAGTVAPDSPRRRAALFQAASQAANSQTQAALIAAALGRAPAAGLAVAVDGVYAPLLRRLAPAPGLVRFAPAFARALIQAGDGMAAIPWVRLVRANAGDPAAAAALPGLALLSGLSGTLDPAWIAAARGLLVKPAPTPEARRLAAAARLLAALAESGTAPAPPPPAGGFADPGLGVALRAAAASGRRGETVLFALIALGDGGPAAADPAQLDEVLAALQRIGLEADARALAIEAAIANGA